MLRNVAGQKLRVYAWNVTTGLPVAADQANITAKLSKDGGALAATNDVNPAALESGYYEFDLTQAESDADELLVVPVSATANVVVVGVPARIWTEPVGQRRYWENAIPYEVSADTVPTTTEFSVAGLGGLDLADVEGKVVLFDKGVAGVGGIARTVVGYADGTTYGTLTLSKALPAAPISTNPFTLLPGTAGEVAADMLKVQGEEPPALSMRAGARSMIRGKIIGAGTTDTILKTDLHQTTSQHTGRAIAGFYKGDVRFEQDPLDGQFGTIASYAADGTIVLTAALTSVPADGLEFVIV